MNNHYKTELHRGVIGKATVLYLALCLGAVGCGGGSLASVSGKVLYNGEPVRGGTLIFHPLGASPKDPAAGRPASAEVQPDGSYTLGTNKLADGAKVGRHSVGFTPPPQQLTDQQRTDPTYITPPPLYMGMIPKTNEVEVKPGSNTIDIELVYPSPR